LVLKPEKVVAGVPRAGVVWRPANAVLHQSSRRRRVEERRNIAVSARLEYCLLLHPKFGGVHPKQPLSDEH
jgi:hypothetical protein